MTGLPPRFEIADAEIDRVVEVFYDRVRAHHILGPIFATHVQDWPAHEEKIGRFWKGAILHQAGYDGSPMMAHRLAGNVGPEHFPIWLGLFDDTLRSTLNDPVAAAGWSALVHRIGQGLRMGGSDMMRPSGPVPELR